MDGSTGELDFWTDAQFIAQSMEQLRENGAAFKGTCNREKIISQQGSQSSLPDLYVSGPSQTRLTISAENRRELLSVLQRILAMDSSLGRTQNQLLESMYNDHFQARIALPNSRAPN